jgi:hypothetical protein
MAGIVPSLRWSGTTDDGMLKEAAMPAVEERIARLEGQVGEISLRLTGIEAAIRHLELRFDALEDKMSRQFMWIVGIQVTTLLTVIPMLGAIVVTLLSRT